MTLLLVIILILVIFGCVGYRSGWYGPYNQQPGTSWNSGPYIGLFFLIVIVLLLMGRI